MERMELQPEYIGRHARFAHVDEYVDNRGVWATYVRGYYAVSLEGKPRDITVEDARAVVKELRGI